MASAPAAELKKFKVPTLQDYTSRWEKFEDKTWIGYNWFEHTQLDIDEFRATQLKDKLSDFWFLRKVWNYLQENNYQQRLTVFQDDFPFAARHLDFERELFSQNNLKNYYNYLLASKQQKKQIILEPWINKPILKNLHRMQLELNKFIDLDNPR